MMIIMVKGFVPQVIWLHELPYVERALKKGVKKKKLLKFLYCVQGAVHVELDRSRETRWFTVSK